MSHGKHHRVLPQEDGIKYPCLKKAAQGLRNEEPWAAFFNAFQLCLVLQIQVGHMVPVFDRSHVLSLGENPDEVGLVVESAVVADF